MIRMLISFGIFVVAAAAGLLAAVLILDDMTCTPTAFAVDVVVFAVLRAILAPFILKMTIRNAAAIAGASGLIATFLALLIVTWLSDGLRIDGAATWVLATMIAWLASMAASLIIPLLIAKGLLGVWLQRRCPEPRGGGAIPVM